MDVGPAGCYDVLRYLRHEGLYVDALILSHLDEDHAGALGALLASEIEIGRIVMPSGVSESDASLAVREALELANERGVSIETASAGAKIVSGGFV
ncbi:MAG: MBL fold metallo-hydrolase [Christensenellales bacterium]